MLMSAERKRKTVNEVIENNPNTWLGNITERDISKEVNEIVNKQWHVKIIINEKPLEFKIDTGADVTVIPFDTYMVLLGKRKLLKTKNLVHGPGGSKLEITGVMKRPEVQ